MNSEVLLVVVFNHRYDSNIEKIKRIYKGRFRNVIFSIPFYNGPVMDDVVTTYDSSYNFHGMIAQTLSQIRGKKYNHYIFVADDLILNPSINEDNYMDYFGIDMDESLVCEIKNLVDTTLPLRCYLNVIDGFTYFWGGVHYGSEICDCEEAINCMKAKSQDFGKIIIKKENAFNPRWKENKLFMIRRPKVAALIWKGNYRLPYPIMTGFSDFFIVSGEDIDKFEHFIGVFAAMNIQVELSIPTAMATVISKLKILENKKNVMHGNADEIGCLYNYNYDNLIAGWEKDLDYMHPIKLSKWKV